MQKWLGNRAIGHVERETEIQLGQILSKKPCTIDYDFPGAAYYVGRRVDGSTYTSERGIVPKFTIYFRQTTSPYKFQPLFLAKIQALPTNHGDSELVFEESDGLALGAANTATSTTANDFEILSWDESAGAFVESASDIASARAGGVTLNGTLASVAVSDLVMVGDGAKNVQDWVISDERLNLRSDNKPVAIAADVIASLIYDGRLNADAICQWRHMSTGLKAYFLQRCNRLFADTL
jgi:hypothetical protein